MAIFVAVVSVTHFCFFWAGEKALTAFICRNTAVQRQSEDALQEVIAGGQG
jgi:hypothetical protein